MPGQARQPWLPFWTDRREMTGGVLSWVDAGVVQFRREYPHSVDFAWPWWSAGLVWTSIRQGTNVGPGELGWNERRQP